jgi:hypothetical protein
MRQKKAFAGLSARLILIILGFAVLVAGTISGVSPALAEVLTSSGTGEAGAPAANSYPLARAGATPPASGYSDPKVRGGLIHPASTPQFGRVITGLYDDWYKTPVPAVTPPPPPGGVITSITESVSNVFHHLVFPVQTISDALLEIFKSALNKEQHATMNQESLWISAFYSLFQAPPAGVYSSIATESLKVAAALAAGLFLLRLAIYNWNRLLGEEDTPVRVIGDWLTAGLLALGAGPLLDMINRTGWWIMGIVIGNAANLAISFADGLITTRLDSALSNTTFIGPIIMIALMVASLLAVMGIIVAFASGHSVMYVLAAIGPVCMVAGVIPPARWIRGMWLKAAVIVALLPIVAAGVFKAGIEAVAHLENGVAQEMFRILWLFGVTGFLLSLSGILTRFTIGTAGDALGKLGHLGSAIVQKAVIAGSAMASGGASAAGSALALGGGLGLGGGGEGGASAASLRPAGAFTERSPGGDHPVGGFAPPNFQDARGSAGTGEAAGKLGIDESATHYQTKTQQGTLSARQVELDERIAARAEQVNGGQREGGSHLISAENVRGFGYTPEVNGRLSEIFPGPGGVDSFHSGLNGLSDQFKDPNISVDDLVTRYPEDMGLLALAYLRHSAEINSSAAPLWTASYLGGASEDFIDGLLGER